MKDEAFLYTFRMAQTGELSYLGAHGAFLDGQVTIDPIPEDYKLDVITVALTSTNTSINKSSIAFVLAMHYPLSKQGKPLFLSEKAHEIIMSDSDKLSFLQKAGKILPEYL